MTVLVAAVVALLLVLGGEMAKSGLSSGFGGTTTFAFGSSDLHRVPDKPFAPSQGLKTLEGAGNGLLFRGEEAVMIWVLLRCLRRLVCAREERSDGQHTERRIPSTPPQA